MDKGLFDGLNGLDTPTKPSVNLAQSQLDTRTRDLMRECINNLTDICEVRHRNMDVTQRNYEELLLAITTQPKAVISARFDGFTSTLEYRRKYSSYIDRSLQTFRELLALLP